MSTGSTERVIHLMYGAGGGGHRASAEAVASVLASSGAGVRGELVNASSIAGAAPGDALYNLFLSYNAISLIELLNSAAVTLLPIATPAIRLAFRAYWAEPPDAVVSFVPILNRIFAQVLPRDVPFFTVLTDFSHTAGHPWLQHPRQHVIVGTDLAERQAIKAGYCEHVGGNRAGDLGSEFSRTSGMVVHPRFYLPHLPEERARIVADAAFDISLPTVLILYGGSPPTGTVTKLFELLCARTGRDAVNTLVVCGRNRALYERLRTRVSTGGIPRAHIAGFTRNIPTLMQLADVMIGKPGPGVVSEAFVSRLPLLLVCGENDTGVMNQEKDVLAWVRNSGVGIIVRTSEEAAAVSRSQMELMKENISNLPRNTAVFEVLNLLLVALGLPPNVGEAHDYSKFNNLAANGDDPNDRRRPHSVPPSSS